MGVYHKDQHPQGSSSGSAVGTALGLCAAALGSEVRNCSISSESRGLNIADADLWQSYITCAEIRRGGHKTHGRLNFEIWIV